MAPNVTFAPSYSHQLFQEYIKVRDKGKATVKGRVRDKFIFTKYIQLTTYNK